MCKEFSPTEDRWVYGELRKFDGPGPSEHNAARTALRPQPIPHGFVHLAFRSWSCSGRCPWGQEA